MRHHYVPEFLQRPWADTTPDGKIEVFRLDLDHLPSRRHTPKHIGFEHELYALSKPVVAGMEQQAIEKQFLRQVDNRSARVRDKLEHRGLRALTPEDRVDWARFIMSLRLRQPDVIQMLKSKSEEHLKATLAAEPVHYEELAVAEDPPTLEAWTEKHFPGLIENFGLSFSHELVDNPRYGNKILNMKWWIWDFSGVSYDLLLADHPCIFTAGIDDPNLVIALPIAPKKAFMTTQSEHVAKILRVQRPRDLAVRLNELSTAQARIRIYARNRAPERFLRNRLQKRMAQSHAL